MKRKPELFIISCRTPMHSGSVHVRQVMYIKSKSIYKTQYKLTILAFISLVKIMLCKVILPNIIIRVV